jgi:mono/diheme cytochrome c family protein
LQAAVTQELRKWCGTPNAPKLIGGDAQQSALLQRGEEVYRRNCQQCHGVTGDGAGPAAAFLTPRPRDYRRGIFKFTSTPYGSKPHRDDLMRTLERGVIGTSMPSFRLMSKHDREAVLEYVLALTHRGELEELLISQAESEGELTEEAVQELVQSIVDRWATAQDSVIDVASKMPPITPESIAAGAEIFQKRECFKCHGRDGRGGLAGGIEVGNDAWGHKDPAADLTSGLLHGGQLPIDVYRRISSGINGTPMPSFRDSFASEPESMWQLTHYVLSLANQRRRGVQFSKQETTALNVKSGDTHEGSQTVPAENTP